MLAALVLPALERRGRFPVGAPILLTLTLAAVLLFAAARLAGPSRAIALGFAGALCGAVTTLALLRDGGVGARPRQAIGPWCLRSGSPRRWP